MAAAAGDDRRLINLTCTVCNQVYREPVILGCSHNFCQACIQDKWRAGGTRTCPTCHKAHPEGQLIVNRALANLVQKQREAPQVAERDAARSNVKCEEHQENIRLYCRDDGEVCCVVCRDALRHSGHDFMTVLDATAKCKDLLDGFTEVTQSEKEMMQRLIKEQEEQIEQHWENTVHLKCGITSEFEKLHKILNTREKGLLEELRVEADAMDREMEENLKKLKSECQRMETVIANNNARAGQEDPVTFLTDIKAFFARCQEERDNFFSIDYRVLSRELCRGMFKGPLQYAAWKELHSAINPVAACLTMDPQTAHPKLILSEDDTKARYRRWSQLLSNNPERFTHEIIALASVGFTTGRHYWEVEVGGKTQWVIGLAKETVNRKQVTAAPKKDGYWAICQAAKGQYAILDAPLKPLPLRSTPQKIGVYLDYEGGQISFYNAGDMTHLHTFTDTFDTRLFPYFSPGLNPSDDNAEPIKLFQPQI